MYIITRKVIGMYYNDNRYSEKYTPAEKGTNLESLYIITKVKLSKNKMFPENCVRHTLSLPNNKLPEYFYCN